VAQTERADRCVFSERKNDAAFRIGKIDEQRLRAKLFDLVCQIKYQWERAQGKEKPAGTAIFTKRVTDAVFAWDRKVELPKPVGSIAWALRTKLAPSSAARRSVVCSMITPAPILEFSNFATSVIFESFAGLRPTSTSVEPRSSLLQKMSRSIFRPKEMLVAPKKAILVGVFINVSFCTRYLAMGTRFVDLEQLASGYRPRRKKLTVIT
jgi:hypothetical protein